MVTKKEKGGKVSFEDEERRYFLRMRWEDLSKTIEI
jgi:hypothetical protein